MTTRGRIGQQIEQKSEEIRSWPVWAQPLPSHGSPNEMPSISARGRDGDKWIDQRGALE